MTKTLLSEQVSHFQYKHAYKEESCSIGVKVQEFKYGNDSVYYYISYELTPEDQQTHRSLSDLGNGEIVLKNEMTSSMIALLMMPDDELNEFTGNTEVSDYKTSIMKALQLFWD